VVFKDSGRSMIPTTPDSKPLILFYSYAHEDERHLKRLIKHLSPLKHEGLIEEWYDRDIAAGDDWRTAINLYVETADIILFLVSADFVASDYCWDIEMTRALERHDAREALVIPLIVQPVDWTGTPFGKLQALPKDGKAVTLWSNREAAWMNVAKGIRTEAEKLARRLPVTRVTSGSSLLVSMNQGRENE
jgi:hypothetical protein